MFLKSLELLGQVGSVTLVSNGVRIGGVGKGGAK